MSGSGMIAGDPSKEDRVDRFARGIRAWARDANLQPMQAANQLMVGRQFFGDAIAGRMDPLTIGPSTAMRILQVTGLTAAHLGFEVPAREGNKPPLVDARGPAVARGQAGDVPAAGPQTAAGTPVIYCRDGSPIGAWYEAPNLIGLRIGGDERRMGELLTRMSIDEAEQASAALAQAAAAGRRAHAKATMEA